MTLYWDNCFPTWQHSLHVIHVVLSKDWKLSSRSIIKILDLMLCIYYSRFLFGGIVGINVKLITVCFWINASFAICYNDFACRYWGGCSLGRHYWDSGGSVRSSRVYFYCLENQVGLSIYPYHHTCISYCALKFMLRETFIFFLLIIIIFIIW